MLVFAQDILKEVFPVPPPPSALNTLQLRWLFGNK